jgi:hypothetical protein
MTEAGSPHEEVAHDDLCPVSPTTRLVPPLWRSQTPDLPVASLHACAHAMQSPALRVVHGPMG